MICSHMFCFRLKTANALSRWAAAVGSLPPSSGNKWKKNSTQQRHITKWSTVFFVVVIVSQKVLLKKITSLLLDLRYYTDVHSVFHYICMHICVAVIVCRWYESGLGFKIKNTLLEVYKFLHEHPPLMHLCMLPLKYYHLGLCRAPLFSLISL